MSQLDAYFDKMNKKFGNEVMFKGSSELLKFETVPSGLLQLDRSMFGGLVVGRLHEFFGEQHGGKSLLSLVYAAQFQKKYPKRDVIYVDTEMKLDKKWAAKIGVDLKRLRVVNGATLSAETIFDITNELISTDEASLIILDSVGHLVSENVLEESVGKVDYTGIAKVMKRFTIIATGLLSRHKTTLIVINQVVDKIGAMVPMIETTGGRALKHNASTRIQLRMGNYIDDKGDKKSRSFVNPSGNYIEFILHKLGNGYLKHNKGEFLLKYGHGIDYAADLAGIAMDLGVVRQFGSMYKYWEGDEEQDPKYSWKGKETFREALRNDAALYEELFKVTFEKLDKEPDDDGKSAD